MKKLDSITIINNCIYGLLGLMLLMTGCKETEYAELVKTEMAKQIENDSLFLGMFFGQTKKEFFDKCWKLNNEGIIHQSTSNNFVEYRMPQKEGDPVDKAITMLFYGVFNEEGKMTGMDLKYFYVAWSLWNKSLQSEQLVPVVQERLKAWFPGNDFILVPPKKTKGEIYVKIDGYRRIVIEPLKDNREVDVRIDDLRYIID